MPIGMKKRFEPESLARLAGVSVPGGTLAKILLIGIIAASLSISHLRAAEQQPPAKLEAKKGNVEYIARDQKIPTDAPVGLPLFARDLLHTLENSKATVWIKDRHPVELGELSTLEILPAESRSSLMLNLVQGALYF